MAIHGADFAATGIMAAVFYGSISPVRKFYLMSYGISFDFAKGLFKCEQLKLAQS